MKRVLFISGSARNGNCKQILETLQSNFWLEYGTEVTFLRDYDLKPCCGCLNCERDDGNACVRDDKFHILIDKVMDADIIVLATPNYFYNVSSLTKNFIDRTFCCYKDKNLVGKKFLYIYIGEDDEKNTKKYLDNAMYGFTICHELNILGSFAYSAGEIGEFSHPELASDTTRDIVSIIRKNLIEE